MAEELLALFLADCLGSVFKGFCREEEKSPHLLKVENEVLINEKDNSAMAVMWALADEYSLWKQDGVVGAELMKYANAKFRKWDTQWVVTGPVCEEHSKVIGHAYVRHCKVYCFKFPVLSMK